MADPLMRETDWSCSKAVRISRAATNGITLASLRELSSASQPRRSTYLAQKARMAGCMSTSGKRARATKLSGGSSPVTGMVRIQELR